MLLIAAASVSSYDRHASDPLLVEEDDGLRLDDLSSIFGGATSAAGLWRQHRPFAGRGLARGTAARRAYQSTLVRARV